MSNSVGSTTAKAARNPSEKPADRITITDWISALNDNLDVLTGELEELIVKLTPMCRPARQVVPTEQEKGTNSDVVYSIGVAAARIRHMANAVNAVTEAYQG